MKNNNFEKMAKGLLFLVPILPLLFIDGYFYPFVIFRTIYFRLLVVILLMVTTYLFYKDPKFIIRFNLAKDKLFNLFGIFVLIMFVTAIFGWNFYNSFFSTFERMEGVVYWAFMWVYYLLLRIYFLNREDWLNFFKFSYGISFILSIYAILQKFSLIDVFHSGIDRAEGTIGNPAFLGAYLLIMIIIGIWIFIIEPNKKWKYLWAIIGVINIFTLFLSLTRSSILGLLIFIFLGFLLFNYYFNSRKYRIISLTLVSSLIFIFIAILIFREQLLSLNYILINRILDISYGNSVIKNRLLVWQGTLEYWPEYIWKGIGIGNFNILFNKFYIPSISEDWFDKTHNAFLDMLVASGLLGFISYLGLYLYPVVLLFKKRKESIFAIVGISFFVAFGINNLFVFDTLNTSFLIITILAFISHEYFRRDDQEELKIYKKHIFASVSIIFSIFSLYYLIYDPLFINHNTYKGYSNVSNNKTESYYAFEKVVGKRFAANETAIQLLNSYQYMVSHNTSEENGLRFLMLTEKSLELAHKFYPNDIRINLHLAQLIINSYVDKENLIKAEPLIKEAIERSPSRAEAYYLLGQLYIKMGENDKSIEVIQEYSQKLPKYPDPLFILANIVYSKDKELARKYFEQAINMGYEKSNLNYKRIIEFLLNEGDFERVLPYYEALVEKNPEEYVYRVDLFQVYYLLDNFDKAMEQIGIINDNNPGLLNDYQDKVNIIVNEYNK